MGKKHVFNQLSFPRMLLLINEAAHSSFFWEVMTGRENLARIRTRQPVVSPNLNVGAITNPPHTPSLDNFASLEEATPGIRSSVANSII